MRILGIPVRVTFFAVLLMLYISWQVTLGVRSIDPFQSPDFYWLFGAAVGLLYWFSILFHEFAHALTARRYGVETAGITLWALGGVSYFKSMPNSPGGTFWTSFNGPLSSFFLAIAFGAAWFFSSLDGVVSGWGLLWFYMAFANLILALFNLLPASPMDGGRVLHSILWKVTGDRRNAKLSASAAGILLGLAMIGTAVFLLLAGIGSWLFLLLTGAFVVWGAWMEYMYTRKGVNETEVASG